jgi:phosphate transport system substrate-binding protein
MAVLGLLVVLPGMAAEAMVQVGGTGSATPVLEALGKAYGRKVPEVRIRALLPPLGSAAARRAVMAGAIDLALSGTPLAPADRERGGRDWELGRSAFVLVTRDAGRLDNIATGQLAEIYSGKVSSWADGTPIRLVLREPRETDNLILSGLSPTMAGAVKVALSRKGLPVAANDLDNMALLEKTPGALGTANAALLTGLRSSLRPVSLNGVAPTLANLERGLYPHAKSLFVIRGPAISPPAQGFLDFMLSAEGRRILGQHAYIPAGSGP